MEKGLSYHWNWESYGICNSTNGKHKTSQTNIILFFLTLEKNIRLESRNSEHSVSIHVLYFGPLLRLENRLESRNSEHSVNIHLLYFAPLLAEHDRKRQPKKLNMFLSNVKPSFVGCFLVTFSIYAFWTSFIRFKLWLLRLCAKW